MCNTKKILTNFLIVLVLLSNASYAFSTTFCEMTKKSVCKCSMNDKENKNITQDKISFHKNSCCKTDVKFISNSSEFESYQKVNIRNISTVFVISKIFQISKPVFSCIDNKDVLIFFNIPYDIPVKNSSLLI